MRIAVGGIMHESNTFADLPTDRRRFEEGSVTRGDALAAAWRDAHHEVGGFFEGAERFGFEVAPTVMAWATPAGPVEDDVIDEVVEEIADGCRRSSADGLLLALHGAMVSRGHADADGEVLRRLRSALAPRYAPRAATSSTRPHRTAPATTHRPRDMHRPSDRPEPEKVRCPLAPISRAPPRPRLPPRHVPPQGPRRQRRHRPPACTRRATARSSRSSAA